MKKLAKYGLILVALGLVLGTTLLFPAVFLKGIIEPIAAVLWAAWRVVTSVHQGVYWGALIVGYVILIIRFLPRENSDPASPAYRHRNEHRTHVERWQALLKGAGVGAEESVNLRESLRNLLASTVGQERTLQPDELEWVLASKRISLSPAAKAYLFPAATMIVDHSGEHHALNASWIPRWFRRWTHRAAVPNYGTIDELLQRMESIMEIRDDK